MYKSLYSLQKNYDLSDKLGTNVWAAAAPAGTVWFVACDKPSCAFMRYRLTNSVLETRRNYGTVEIFDFLVSQGLRDVKSTYGP